MPVHSCFYWVHDVLPFSTLFIESLTLFKFVLLLFHLCNEGRHAPKCWSPLEKEVDHELHSKFRKWQRRYFFVSVLDNFSLPSHWKNLWEGHSERPELSEEKEEFVVRLIYIAREERTF